MDVTLLQIKLRDRLMAAPLSLAKLSKLRKLAADGTLYNLGFEWIQIRPPRAGPSSWEVIVAAPPRSPIRAGLHSPRARSYDVSSAVIRIHRCVKVMKGGRTFSFGSLVAVGDGHGGVGIGYGKSSEIPSSVEKATRSAKSSLVLIPLRGTTIPHLVKGKFGASSVTLVPARPGTGISGAKTIRSMLELAGIRDILSKSYGSTTPKNLVKATMDALTKLRSPEAILTGRKVHREPSPNGFYK